MELAILVDGETVTEIPSDRNYTVTVTCDTEEMSGTWDYTNWEVTIKGQIKTATTCSIEFNSIFKYYIDEEEVKEKPDKSTYLYKNMTCNKGTASYNENTKEETVKSYDEGMECNVYYVTPSTTLFSDYLIAKTLTDSSIIRQEHEETEQTGTNALVDYRYVGGDIDEENYVHNYVCLEASGNCTDDQLYRIIGVIPTQSSEDSPYENRVKLIKAAKYKYVYWSGSKSNESDDWTKSTLNTEILNQTYWNSISSYQKYIEDTKWYLGGSSASNSFLFTSRLYGDERSTVGGFSSKGTIYSVGKIGLMYASDYGYATSGGSSVNRNTCLTTSLYSWNGSSVADCKNNDWLFASSFEQWTLSLSNSWSTPMAYFIRNGGSLDVSVSYFNQSYSRPVFHLRSTVKYQSGDGSKKNPFQIEIG